MHLPYQLRIFVAVLITCAAVQSAVLQDAKSIKRVVHPRYVQLPNLRNTVRDHPVNVGRPQKKSVGGGPTRDGFSKPIRTASVLADSVSNIEPARQLNPNRIFKPMRRMTELQYESIKACVKLAAKRNLPQKEVRQLKLRCHDKTKMEGKVLGV